MAARFASRCSNTADAHLSPEYPSTAGLPRLIGGGHSGSDGPWGPGVGEGGVEVECLAGGGVLEGE